VVQGSMSALPCAADPPRERLPQHDPERNSTEAATWTQTRESSRLLPPTRSARSRTGHRMWPLPRRFLSVGNAQYGGVWTRITRSGPNFPFEALSLFSRKEPREHRALEIDCFLGT
jgi:hypothetical protein